MNLQEYQQEAFETAIYDDKYRIIYPCHGLSEECGEINGHFKRMMRDDNGVLTQERLDHIALELGDIMWYLVVLARDLDIELPHYSGEVVEAMPFDIQHKRLLRLQLVCAELTEAPLDGAINQRKYILARMLTFCIEQVGKVCSAFGFSFYDILDRNIAKLQKRVKNGTLHGSGDDR